MNVDDVRKNLPSLVLISLPALVVILLAIEVALRLAGYVPYYLDRQAFMPSANENAIYTLRPNHRGLYAGVPIQVNSLGFRGAELPSAADAALRVVILGDSIAFGQGVNEHETLSEQLRSRLQENIAGRVLVANLGVPGYDTCQEHIRLSEQGLSFSPHLVYLLYFENDVDPTPFRVKNGIVYSPDVREGWFGDFMAGARIHSALYNLVWSRYQTMKSRYFAGKSDYVELVARKFMAGNPGWERSRACLKALLATASDHSIKLVVIPFPVLGGLDANPYPFQGYIEAVCGVVRVAGAECLDLVSLVRDPALRLRVSAVETHPSADVYRRMAAHLARATSANDRNRSPQSNDNAANRQDGVRPAR